REQRAALQQRIDARLRAAAGAQQHIDRAAGCHAEIIAGDSDPAGWVQQDGRSAVEWAHARRELDIRRELELRDGAEQARLNPPAHVQQTLGERPDRGAERHRYDALAGDLERYRLEHDIDISVHGSLGAQPAGRDPVREQLADRIRDSRQQRGLQPAPVAVELDAELDLGI
ncbi:MAG: hypothetical protein ACRDMZ_16285, partial [Solirubrobacteraceae bacterium]